jgi:hypothetical protein
VAREPGAQALAELAATRLDGRQKLVVDRLEHRERDATAERVAGVRRAVQIELRHRSVGLFDELASRQRGRDREQSRAEPFAGDDDIGQKARSVLKREEPAGATHPRLHLVENEQGAVSAAECLRF